MREIIKRSFSGIVLVAVFTGAMLAGPYSFLAVLLLVYTLGALELKRLYPGEKPFWAWMHLLAGFLLILGTGSALLFHSTPLLLLLPFVIWIGAQLASLKPEAGLLNWFWLAMPLSAYLGLGWLGGGTDYHWMLPLSAIVLVWINDIFAYVCGSLFGKHKLTPVLSPGKTWEGFLGGILFNLLGGWVIYLISDSFSAAVWMLSAGLISLLALGGDLFESRLKRKHGVKDTGKLIPGHGGILDRFDSLLFVAPALLIVILISQLIS